MLRRQLNQAGRNLQRSANVRAWAQYSGVTGLAWQRLRFTSLWLGLLRCTPLLFLLLSPFVDAVILLLWFSPVGWASLHTMQLCLSWTGERAELRITSVELLTEYHLAGVLAYSEVVSGRVEVVQLQGGSVAQRNVICP